VAAVKGGADAARFEVVVVPLDDDQVRPPRRNPALQLVLCTQASEEQRARKVLAA
jgi:hypothetical protein